MSCSVVVSHPFGNPNCFNAAVAFQEHGVLDSFWTSLFAPLGFSCRYHPALRQELVRTRALPEAIRLATTLLPSGPWNGRNAVWTNRAWNSFDRFVAGKLSDKHTAVHAYEDGAAVTFARARTLGLRTIYELPVTYFEEVRRIHENESLRIPELATWMRALDEPDWKREKKDAEIELADVIVVPSTFVRQSLISHRTTKAQVIVVPYGANLTVSPKAWTSEAGPIKLFYAGRLDPSKGIHYLFEALSHLDSRAFVLTLAGSWAPGFRQWLDTKWQVRYQFLGQLPHARLIESYKHHDIFIFPSLHDGFGLVLLEAMAAGIPVAATEQSGAPDIIEHGREGFLFPAASPEALVQTVQHAMRMRDALPEMGQLARARAGILSWERYRHVLFESLTPYLNRI